MIFVRIAIYVVVMFLIMVVYTGQQHDKGSDILRDSLGKTGKFCVWTGGLVLFMEACFWLFID